MGKKDTTLYTTGKASERTGAGGVSQAGGGGGISSWYEWDINGPFSGANRKTIKDAKKRGTKTPGRLSYSNVSNERVLPFQK